MRYFRATNFVTLFWYSWSSIFLWDHFLVSMHRSKPTVLLWTCQQNSTMHTTWLIHLNCCAPGLQTGPVGGNLSARTPGYCQCHCNWWASWELLVNKRSSHVIPEELSCCSGSCVEVQLWNRPIPVPSGRNPKPHVHMGRCLWQHGNHSSSGRCVHTGSSPSCSLCSAQHLLLLYTAPCLRFCTVHNPWWVKISKSQKLLG